MLQAAVNVLQEATSSGLLSSDAIIAFVLGGSVLTTLVGGYRFVVNLRTTERGMARDRVRRANNEARRERAARVRAQHEADAWQAYAGDLTYALRSAGMSVPQMPADLRAMMNAAPPTEPLEDLDEPLRSLQDDLTRGRGGTEEPS